MLQGSPGQPQWQPPGSRSWPENWRTRQEIPQPLLKTSAALGSGLRNGTQHTDATRGLPAVKRLAFSDRQEFNQADVFSLTATCHPPNLARLSADRDDADVGSIYLIRHGQASFGADDYDVLSPLGVRQATLTGQHLVDLGLRFDRCLSGELQRQQDTARHATDQFHAAGLPNPFLEHQQHLRLS